MVTVHGFCAWPTPAESAAAMNMSDTQNRCLDLMLTPHMGLPAGTAESNMPVVLANASKVSSCSLTAAQRKGGKDKRGGIKGLEERHGGSLRARNECPAQKVGELALPPNGLFSRRAI